MISKNSIMMAIIFILLVGYAFMPGVISEGFGIIPSEMRALQMMFHERFDVKQPIIDQLEISSRRAQSEIVADERTGYPKKVEYDMDDPFEEVFTLVGHGYAGYDYKLADVSNETPISFPSKRMLDMVGGPYFIPPPVCDSSNEPKPTDQESMNSRDHSYVGYNVQNNVHPCADVRFDVRDN